MGTHKRVRGRAKEITALISPLPSTYLLNAKWHIIRPTVVNYKYHSFLHTSHTTFPIKLIFIVETNKVAGFVRPIVLFLKERDMMF